MKELTKWQRYPKKLKTNGRNAWCYSCGNGGIGVYLHSPENAKVFKIYIPARIVKRTALDAERGK
jgi:hypothetical protein